MVFCLLVFASPGPFTELGSADGKPLSATSAPAAGCVIHTLVYYITFSPCAQLFCPVSAEKLTCFRRIPFSSPMLFYRLIVFNGRGKLRSPLAPHRNAPSGHSGVSHGLFMISHHRPCGRWCFARLIRQAETLELQLHSQPPSKRTALSPLKHSCFRFAALTLRCRTPLSCPSRTDLSSVQDAAFVFRRTDRMQQRPNDPLSAARIASS